MRFRLAGAIFLLAAPAFAQERAASGSSPEIQAEIQHGLDDSVAGWNSGNLDRFVALYSDSPDSIVSSARGLLHRARSVEIAANRRYFAPDHSDERGRLRYEVLEMKPIDPGHMLALVRFDLENAGAEHLRFGGISAMIFASTGKSWEIIVQADSNLDSSELRPSPPPRQPVADPTPGGTLQPPNADDYAP